MCRSFCPTKPSYERAALFNHGDGRQRRGGAAIPLCFSLHYSSIIQIGGVAAWRGGMGAAQTSSITLPASPVLSALSSWRGAGMTVF